MSSQHIPAALRRRVAEAARFRFVYLPTALNFSGISFTPAKIASLPALRSRAAQNSCLILARFLLYIAPLNFSLERLS